MEKYIFPIIVSYQKSIVFILIKIFQCSSHFKQFRIHRSHLLRKHLILVWKKLHIMVCKGLHLFLGNIELIKLPYLRSGITTYLPMRNEFLALRIHIEASLLFILVILTFFLKAHLSELWIYWRLLLELELIGELLERIYIHCSQIWVVLWRWILRNRAIRVVDVVGTLACKVLRSCHLIVLVHKQKSFIFLVFLIRNKLESLFFVRLWEI